MYAPPEPDARDAVARTLPTCPDLMAIHIDDARRSALLDRLRGFWLEEFEEELTPFRAERVLEFVVETVGPGIYNQAVQDARSFVQSKLDDLEGEVWEPDARA